MKRSSPKPSASPPVQGTSQISSRAAAGGRDERLVAAGKVKMARAMAVLVRGHPFHAHVAAGWSARPDPSVKTMGVGWVCGGVQLVWNPQFIATITEMELAGVLLHEVHHVVLRHPFLFPEQADPPPDFDAYAALVAEEITVNEFVTLPLPGSPMLLEHVRVTCPSLEPLESTRDRYRKLHDPERARRDHRDREELSRTIEEQLERLLAGDRAPGIGAPSDCHSRWESFRFGGAAAALAVAVATAQAMAKHGHALSGKLRRLIEEANRVAGGAAGSTPGSTLETLAGTARGKLSWQMILRRLLAVDQAAEATFLRPPRRFPELVGVLPGRRRIPARLKILAAVDTSASMTSATLDEIAAELRLMSRHYDVGVVEFDAGIQRRYRLGPSHPSPPGVDPLSTMQGRGGTSFLPIFEPETLAWAGEGGELSGIVVFTDGFGPAPASPPREPVIWVLMGGLPGCAPGLPIFGIRRPASWGEVVDGSVDAAGAVHAS